MTDSNLVPPNHANAALVLADGNVFFGRGVGAVGDTFGEICFNTAMTGYQEIMTDLSYAGQIITFTFPHIGNVGTNDEDIESQVPAVRGLVLREPISSPSNFRQNSHFEDWLKKYNITGICDIDTRALTRHIRLNGAQNVAITYVADGKKLDVAAVQKKLKDIPSLEGLELAESVTTAKQYPWKQTTWQLGKGYGTIGEGKYHVVAIDFGEKLNILRLLAARDCRITVVPAKTSADEILALKPDGIFLSNGPGDPAATGKYAIEVLKKLIDSNVPIFGICLGHQLLGLAVGGKTAKMKQGHRGANHPIKNLETGKVEITAQNHGFVVTEESLPKNAKVTHKSLFDGTVAGFKMTDHPVFCVQYHPESSPGPHDSRYLFDRFIEMMEKSAA